MLCTRCGRDAARADPQYERFRVLASWPVPSDVCLRCAFDDPALRAAIDKWSADHKVEVVKGLRAALARPLEAIARFVERFR